MGHLTLRHRSLHLTVLLAVFSVFLTSCSQQTKPDPATRPAGPMAHIEQAFVDENYAKARMLLEPLARQGNADAQYALGYLHYYGLGMVRNEQTAWQWFQAAARQNHNKAITAIKMLETQRQVEQQQESIDAQRAPAAPRHAPAIATPVPDAPPVRSEPAVQPRVAPAPAPTPVITPTPAPMPIPAQAASTVAADKQTESTAGLSWLNSRPSEHYTIQLVSVSRESAAQKFMHEHDLNTEAAYFEQTVAGKPVYAVIVGDFASRSEAQSHYQSLPAKLRLHQPWIRQFSSIQQNP